MHGAEKPPVETDVVFVDLDPELHQLHYEVVSNETLWFLFHGPLRSTATPRLRRVVLGGMGRIRVDQPVVRRRRHRARAPIRHTVLVQGLPTRRSPVTVRCMPRGPCRTSWRRCSADRAIRVLPDRVAEAICASLASVPAGLHTARWAREYIESVRRRARPRTHRRRLVHRAARPRSRRVRRARGRRRWWRPWPSSTSSSATTR